MTIQPATPQWRIEGALLVTRDPDLGTRTGSVQVAGGKICAVGGELPPPTPGEAVIDGSGLIVMPGLIQGHIHLCQTLFRGLADGRRLDRWLKERVWPLEAAHDPETMAASARLGLAEALLCGATTLLDMGSVHHTDAIAAAADEMGARVILGKALMDDGADLTPELKQDAHQALAEGLELRRAWHGHDDGRLTVALAPRFTLSVSAGLWRELAQEATANKILVHTHVSETQWENETCQHLHGSRPIACLADWGVLEAKAALVHAVWLEEDERRMLAEAKAAVIHCPGSNAKLGSGIASIRSLLDAGVRVALGSDGAACNDALSLPAEMRLAAQLQSIGDGPVCFTADTALELATDGGARALGLESQTGRLRPGLAADLIVFRDEDLVWEPEDSLARSLVWSSPHARPRDVYVAGRQLVKGGRLVVTEESALREDATRAVRRLRTRTGF